MLTYEKEALDKLPKRWRPSFNHILRVVDDATMRLFVFKCLPTYPEYQSRVCETIRRAKAEGLARRYTTKHLKAFLDYRENRTLADVKRDRRDALQIFLSRVHFGRYKNRLDPTLIEEFTRLVHNE